MSEESQSKNRFDFLVKEYEIMLALRKEAMTISMNRLTVFLGVTSAATVAIALLAQRLLGRDGSVIFLTTASLILAGVLLIGTSSFFALAEYHVSRVIYLRAANLLRGELADLTQGSVTSEVCGGSRL